MLKQLRKSNHEQNEVKRQIKNDHGKEIEIVESEDETERLEEGEQVVITRPNPLEPSQKHKNILFKNGLQP